MMLAVILFTLAQPVTVPCGRTVTQPCFVKFADGDTCTYENHGRHVTCGKVTPKAPFGGLGIFKATGVSDLPGEPQVHVGDEPLVRDPVYVTSGGELMEPVLQSQLWHCEEKTRALEVVNATLQSNERFYKAVVAIGGPIALLIAFAALVTGILKSLDKIALAWRRSEINLHRKAVWDGVFFVALVLWIISALKGLFS